MSNTAKFRPRGKNQRILALMKIGDERTVKNRIAANSMCETAASMGLRLGTHKLEDGRVLVFRKE